MGRFDLTSLSANMVCMSSSACSVTQDVVLNGWRECGEGGGEGMGGGNAGRGGEWGEGGGGRGGGIVKGRTEKDRAKGRRNCELIKDMKTKRNELETRWQGSDNYNCNYDVNNNHRLSRHHRLFPSIPT